MSLFRKAGKAFEKGKRSIVGGDDPAFVCRSCDRRLEDDSEYCPHCGEASVEPLE